MKISSYGGRWSNFEPIYDGVHYMFRSTWNSDEDIDRFLEAHSSDITKSDRVYIGGYLTLFFSINTK